jgi:hypothetical protein
MPGVGRSARPDERPALLGSDPAERRVRARLRVELLRRRPRVAVIGSREASASGLAFAREISAAIIERGGVVVSGLAGKERRDFLASERRQRAALHRLPPFAVLILDGVIRRPIAGPIAAVLEAVGSSYVDGGIIGALLDCHSNWTATYFLMKRDVLDHLHRPASTPAGSRWAGLAGIRRFAGRTFLEAGWVIFGDDPPRAVPLADLERFV